MFTGIITEMGRVASCVREKGGLRVRVNAPETARGLAIGGSVSVDGVCLTAIDVDPRGFSVQVIPETSKRSTLRPVRLSVSGRRVNLERPLGAAGEVGGHFVQGHVDATARVATIRKTSQGTILALQLPANLVGLVVVKGSIAVNGVSLTVASADGGVRGRGRRQVSVALIPHTLEHTNLGSLRAGELVNIEADILGKYVHSYLRSRR